MPSKSITKIYLIFLLIILLWGINWPINKIGLQYMPTVWHAAFRSGIGCVIIFFFVFCTGKLKLPTRQDLPIIFTVGTLQIGLFILFINLGLNYVAAGRSAILVYTTPLWVLPIAILFFKEKISWLKAVGFGLGILGIFILFNPFNMDWSLPETLYGNSFLLLAALSFAIAICCARHMKWTSPPLVLLPWQLLVSTLVIVPFVWVMSPSPNIQWDGTCISAMLYAVFATAVGNWGATLISKNLSPITVSIGFLGVPLCGVISAALILDEPITASMKLAMIFIFTGIFFVALSNRKKETRNTLKS